MTTRRNTARNQLIRETGRDLALHAEQHDIDPLDVQPAAVLDIATARLNRVPSVRMERYLNARIAKPTSVATAGFVLAAQRFAASLIDGNR